MVNGLLLLDKGLGVSSNQALQSVRRLYAPPRTPHKKLPKAGHTGTLDPLASGLLVVCFGQATKVAHFVLDANKTYEVTMRLGERTTTGDAEGQVVSTHPVPEDLVPKVPSVLSQFTGPLMQVPSMYSALKHQGKPLYEWARQGIEIPRQPRPVTIYAVDRLPAEDPHTISVSLCCSKGMYVRTWVDDIGQALGCGAHVTSLRRVAVGQFEQSKMHTLEVLADMSDAERMACVLPTQMALSHFPAVQVDDVGYYYLRRGQPVSPVGCASAGQWVQIVNMKGEFLIPGYVLSDGRVATKAPALNE